MYSEHPNTGLARISKILFLSGSEMVQFSNVLEIQKPDKNIRFLNGLLGTTIIYKIKTFL